MERLLSYLPIFCAGIGVWAILNGVLHDIFVLAQGRKYDRDLLRLLLDGHILITVGIMQAIAYVGLKDQQPWALYLAGAACISMLIYCGMIFPFLTSYVIVFLNISVLILVLLSYFKNSVN